MCLSKPQTSLQIARVDSEDRQQGSGTQECLSIKGCLEEFVKIMSIDLSKVPVLIETISLSEFSSDGERPVLVFNSRVNVCERCFFNFATTPQLHAHQKECRGEDSSTD